MNIFARHKPHSPPPARTDTAGMQVWCMDEIRAYWRERGCEVDLQTQVYNSQETQNRGSFPGIRSNMLNGLPRGFKADEAWFA